MIGRTAPKHVTVPQGDTPDHDAFPPARGGRDGPGKPSLAPQNGPANLESLPHPDPAFRSDAGRPGGWFLSSPSTAAMGLYVPATIVIRLINLVRVIMFTWFMTTQQFGLLNMLLLVINVLTPVCSLGLNEAVTRYVPQQESRGTVTGFLRRSLLLVALTTVAAMTVLIVVAPYTGVRFYGQLVYDQAIREIVQTQFSELTRLSALVIGLLGFYFFVLAILKGLRMFRALVLIEFLHSTAFLLLALAACVAERQSAKSMTVCYGLSLLAALTLCGFGLQRAVSRWSGQDRPCDAPDLYRRMLSFSRWAMISGFTWQLLQYYPAWYLNKVMGNDAVAVFSAVRQVGQFILLGAVTLVTVVMTAVTKTWETHGVDAADRQLSLAFRGAGTIMFFGCAVLALGRNVVIQMFNPSYAPGADILPLQLLFFLVSGNFAFIALHFNLIEKPRMLFLPYAVGVAANILVAYWLVRRPDILAALPGWQTVSAAASAVLCTGLSDPLGLGAAAWAGATAILASLVACLVLLRAERRPIDRGSAVVLAAALLLGLNDLILILGAAVFAFFVWRTELVFSRAERRNLVGYAFAAAGTLVNGSPGAHHHAAD